MKLAVIYSIVAAISSCCAFADSTDSAVSVKAGSYHCYLQSILYK